MIVEQRILDFREKAFGLFVHYGAYTQYGHGEWVLNLRNLDPKEYEKKALSFDYSQFDAEKLVKAAKVAGAKYITLTTRHHDGFSLYDTRGLNEYDAPHACGGRDLVKEFVDACREYDIMPFFYHTTADWHHPDFENNFPQYLKYLRASVEILCRNYGKIGGFWFDGNWSKPAGQWELDELYGVVRKYQPDAIIINNTGLEAQGLLGHREIDCVTFEQGHAQQVELPGKYNKFYIGEMCYPLCEHWGLARDINYKSMKAVLGALVSCRKVGANLLLGVTPKEDCSLPTIQQGFLEELGRWVSYNRSIFYKGVASDISGEGGNFALELDNDHASLFVCDVTTWGDVNVMKQSPARDAVFHNVTRPVTSVRWSDCDEPVCYHQDLQNGTLTIEAPHFRYGDSLIVRVADITF